MQNNGSLHCFNAGFMGRVTSRSWHWRSVALSMKLAAKLESITAGIALVSFDLAQRAEIRCRPLWLCSNSGGLLVH